MTLDTALSANSLSWCLVARGGRGTVLGWLEKLRSLWERRFDRLAEHLRKLQQKECPDGRKK